MKINNKPILIDVFNRVLMLSHAPLERIERTSEGIVGKPEQIEDVELIWKDGSIERFSIRDIDETETFMAICEAITKHG